MADSTDGSDLQSHRLYMTVWRLSDSSSRNQLITGADRPKSSAASFSFTWEIQRSGQSKCVIWAGQEMREWKVCVEIDGDKINLM